MYDPRKVYELVSKGKKKKEKPSDIDEIAESITEDPDLCLERQNTSCGSNHFRKIKSSVKTRIDCRRPRNG
jgi:hypothetical protein